jgi:hypothetical protein
VSDRSSWERQPGVRMIWNGAGQSEHDSAVPTGAGTRALSIVLQRTATGAPSSGPMTYKNEWLFFQGAKGVPAACRQEGEGWKEKFGTSGDAINKAPWPTISMKLSKLHGKECEYKNNGQNPGALWCKGRPVPINCHEDQAKKNKATLVCVQGSYGIERRPTAYCEW